MKKLNNKEIEELIEESCYIADRYVSYLNAGEDEKKLTESVEMAKIAVIIELNQSIKELTNQLKKISSK